MAKEIGGLEPDMVAAAALAHDLGHPPFGHVAEKVLQEIIEGERFEKSDSFEGNAQSFRVVTKLAVRRTNSRGLDLTRGTLNGLLKYPRFRREIEGKKEEKWGAYHSEEREFNFARKGCGVNQRTIEAELVDFADDVAYSTHDLEDFYRAGLIPLERLLTDQKERDRFLVDAKDKINVRGKSIDDVANIFDSLLNCQDKITPNLHEPYNGRINQRGAIRTFCSTLINRFFDHIELNKPRSSNESFVKIDPSKAVEIKLLKRLVWYYVINNRTLAAQEHGQREVVTYLFGIFFDLLKDRSKV